MATTGSTPVAVDKTGTPLALHPDFMEDPDAMFILWKDHSSFKETSQFNAHAKRCKPDYLRYVGGIYSSEWYWSKLLHILRNNPLIRKHCISFVEHCDWMPFLLTGGNDISQMKRSVCTAVTKPCGLKTGEVIRRMNFSHLSIRFFQVLHLLYRFKPFLRINRQE
jgi:L-ribulokinase